jgi:hypothetical protein
VLPSFTQVFFGALICLGSRFANHQEQVRKTHNFLGSLRPTLGFNQSQCNECLQPMSKSRGRISRSFDTPTARPPESNSFESFTSSHFYSLFTHLLFFFSIRDFRFRFSSEIFRLFFTAAANERKKLGRRRSDPKKLSLPNFFFFEPKETEK